MMALLLIAIIFGFLLVFVVLSLLRRPSNLPPGPSGLPFVGVYHKLGNVSKCYMRLHEWLKEYKSGIISFYLGSTRVVVLGDLEVMKDALLKNADAFSGRPVLNPIKGSSAGLGLVMTNGELFREQRRFALHTLRDFGLGKQILEAKIIEECEFVVEILSNTNQKPYDLQFLLNNAVANVICSMVFGRRFDYEDQEFQNLLDMLNWRISKRQINFLSPIIHLSLYKLFRFIPGNNRVRSNLKKNEEIGKKLDSFAQKQIDLHREHFDPNNEPADYIDAFLRAEATNQGNYFFDEQLITSLLGLFAAGTETTSTSLRWGILYMALYPDVQENVFQEINKVIGIENTPTMADRNKLRYTDAAILETQRLANLAPMAVAHSTTKDSTLMGYSIPKGTLVIPLLWAMHKNEQYFPNPESFEPERFLGESGNKMEAFMPFSIGKRACLGESLAKMELFLFYTTMFQRFRFEFPKGADEPDLIGYAGITISPNSFDIVAIPR